MLWLCYLKSIWKTVNTPKPVKFSSKAREIINYREQNGGFKNIEDLRKIKGFGEKTFEKIKEHLVV